MAAEIGSQDLASMLFVAFKQTSHDHDVRDVLYMVIVEVKASLGQPDNLGDCRFDGWKRWEGGAMVFTLL